MEFGADYYSGGGKPSRKRWYGVVTAISPEEVAIEQEDTAAAAIKRSEEIRRAADPRVENPDELGSAPLTVVVSDALLMPLLVGFGWSNDVASEISAAYANGEAEAFGQRVVEVLYSEASMKTIEDELRRVGLGPLADAVQTEFEKQKGGEQ